MASPPLDEPRGARSEGRPLDAGCVLLVLLALSAAFAALSIDVVRTTAGIKGDEASYVAMALSVAHDGDLAFDRGDLERFWRLYRRGPEGIFLKRGRTISVGIEPAWPFLRVTRLPDTADRLYFGKAYIYSVVAAPFVWLAGLNGLLLLQVLLVSGVLVAAHLFLRERCASPTLALVVAVGFVGASIAPLYLVWMTPEIFNFSMVAYAYVLWLFKEVTRDPRDGIASRLCRPGTDWLAAALLGIATFSKPSNLLLIGPIVLLAAWRRQWRHSVGIAATFGGVVLAAFLVNVLVSGEMNYQGGDRKTFYGRFPFESGQSDFEALGTSVTTNELSAGAPAAAGGFWQQLGHNLVYFVVGRHFGLLAYYFPGVLLVALWLWRRADWEAWQLLTAGFVAATVLALLVWLPNTWSGGGGPPRDRYFLSVYPALLFLAPPIRSVGVAVAMWVGGMVFMAQVLVDPFVAAKRPGVSVQQGLFRALPVELTMVNDLPVMLDQSRARVPYGRDPTLLLYFLDDNASRPEAPGIWIGGQSRADIIVRTAERLSALRVTARSPIANHLTLVVDGTRRALDLEPGRPVTVTLPVEGLFARGAYGMVLSVTTRRGFVPRLADRESTDPRFLGASMTIEGVRAGGA